MRSNLVDSFMFHVSTATSTTRTLVWNPETPQVFWNSVGFMSLCGWTILTQPFLMVGVRTTFTLTLSRWWSDHCSEQITLTLSRWWSDHCSEQISNPETKPSLKHSVQNTISRMWPLLCAGPVTIWQRPKAVKEAIKS